MPCCSSPKTATTTTEKGERMESKEQKGIKFYWLTSCLFLVQMKAEKMKTNKKVSNTSTIPAAVGAVY